MTEQVHADARRLLSAQLTPAAQADFETAHADYESRLETYKRDYAEWKREDPDRAARWDKYKEELKAHEDFLDAGASEDGPWDFGGGDYKDPLTRPAPPAGPPPPTPPEEPSSFNAILDGLVEAALRDRIDRGELPQ